MDQTRNLGLIIERILSERRIPNIIELTEVLKEVDSNSEASKITKTTILTTLGFGKIGERYPITLENAVAWCDLVNLYLNSKNELGRDHPYTKSVSRLVLSSTFHLISRSFTKKNSHLLFDYLSKEWQY